MPTSTQYPNVSLFKARPLLYKLGLLFLFGSFLIFIIGFSSPYWISFEYKEDDDNEVSLINSDKDLDDFPRQFHSGLWNALCFSSAAACKTGIIVAQTAFSFHLAGYVVSLVLAAYENCRKVNPVTYHSRMLELCVFITGFLGTAGMAMFVGWYSTSFHHTGFQWSLAVTLISLCGIYLTFFLIFFGNRKTFMSTRGTVLVPPQQGVVIYYDAGNPSSVSTVPGYQPSHAGNQPQNQPLLPPHPYFYTPVNHPFSAPPPAYSLPPAYPLPPSQPPSFAYPGYYEHQHEGHAQASAPPYDDTMRQKS